ncbi:MAG: DUF3109 family protein [Candidatus Scalindua sp. AMX11]|nr:MAG: DUF3109 family protein [Candidatus Scalindua sp.]NOG85216.1 DUF3109 family protein [Planctomycetota bacterium]RZV66138.1 MAG: DUF3109 family protein [Candidatus Scalindua sp. SCAELEC01]TDE63553.1 MAG: DUF3109 family protein [Candidatus Scalindua sp. AMX11]GJQ60867.1 MAG: hypothetical protein SCALA701_36680 [Candidatus Scalindua sp.]
MNKLFPIINGIKVDLESLTSIRHVCDPGMCAGKYTCCAHYEICLGKREVGKVIRQMPGAARYAPHLKERDSYKNVFEETEDNLIAIDTDGDDQCLFAWRNRKGEILCSLHSQAIETGRSFYDAKPTACCLWPLAICSGNPMILSVQDDAFKFVCNKKRRTGRATLDKEIASIIKNIYGEKMLAGINRALSEI